MRIEFSLDEINCMISVLQSIPYRPLKHQDFMLLEKFKRIRDQQTWKPCQCKGS